MLYCTVLYFQVQFTILNKNIDIFYLPLIEYSKYGTIPIFSYFKIMQSATDGAGESCPMKLRRTVELWTLTRGKLLEIYEEILLCQHSHLYDLTRSCEDTMCPSPFIIECREARKLCSRALVNLHTMNSFNLALVSLVTQLKRKKIIKPLCLSCVAKAVPSGLTSTPGYLGLFCPSCSLLLVDSTEAFTAYSRFLHLFERLFQERGREKALSTIKRYQQICSETLDLICRLPTTATEIPSLS